MHITGLGQWLKQIAGGITVVAGLITTLVAFAQMVQGETGLVTLISLVVGIGLIWLTCLYFARFWQPEKQDKALNVFQPPPTAEQERDLARRVRQRKAVRRSAKVGLVLVPLLVLAGYSGWQHVQGLPSKEVVILIAEFDGPEAQKYRVTETILGQLRAATKEYPDVRVETLEEPVTEQMGSYAARELGENRKASIMIWGWYGKTDTNVPISVNFEVLQPPEHLPEFDEIASGAVQAFAISELNTFQLQTRLSSEMAYLTLFTLGMARYAAEDWEGAIARFNDALEQPKSPVVSLDVSSTHYFKGNAYSSKEDYENAITAYDAALALKPDFHKALHGKGLALLSLKRYEEALANNDAALALKPDDPLTLNVRGILLFHLKRYEEALASNDNALALKPDDPFTLNVRGVMLRDLNRYEEAITVIDAALAIKPEDPFTLNSKGTALYSLKRYEEAITAYDAALAIKPEDPFTLNSRGNALYSLKRYEEAITSYDAALALKPDYTDTLYNKGNALRYLKRYEEAITAYDATLALKPDYTDAFYNKGLALRYLKRYEEAITAFDSAIAIKPDDLNALYYKGLALHSLKRYEEAIMAYDAALAIKPDAPNTLNNKGVALGNLKRYEEAIAVYDAALALNLDFPYALYNKARVYALQGKVEPAIENLDKAIQLNPDEYRELARTNTDFDSIRDDPRFKVLIASK